MGIGRPACLKPALPRDIVFNSTIPDEQAVFGGYSIPGAELAKMALGGGSSVKVPPKPEAPLVASYAETEPARETSSLLPKELKDQRKVARSRSIPLIGAGVSTFWHEWQLSRLARGLEPDPRLNWFLGAIWEGLVRGLIGGLWNLFSSQ